MTAVMIEAGWFGRQRVPKGRDVWLLVGLRQIGRRLIGARGYDAGSTELTVCLKNVSLIEQPINMCRIL